MSIEQLRLYYVSKLISLIPSYRSEALWAHCDHIERLLEEALAAEPQP